MGDTLVELGSNPSYILWFSFLSHPQRPIIARFNFEQAMAMRCVMILITLFALSACGQKGALYMPTENPSQSEAS